MPSIGLLIVQVAGLNPGTQSVEFQGGDSRALFPKLSAHIPVLSNIS